MLEGSSSVSFTDLRRDGQGGAETVHRFVILPAQVEQNSQPALELRVHLGGIRIRRLQEQILHVGKQSPAREKEINKGRKKQKVNI